MTTRRAFLSLPLLAFIPKPEPSWKPEMWRKLGAIHLIQERRVHQPYVHHFRRPDPVFEQAVSLHQELPILSLSLVREPTDANCRIRKTT